MADEREPQPRYRVRPVTTPVAPAEDDDGYDPYSDRPADPEPTYQEDPWR